MTAKNGLQQRLGLGSTTSIVVANMIGAGIFTTSGLLMQDLGNPWVMIALWAIGGVIATCGALCYGELGASMPQAGGEYVFLSKLFHPLLGFLTGWVSFVAGFSAPIAASAIGFSEYLFRAWPSLFYVGFLADASLETTLIKKAIAVLVIFVFTAIHMRGLRLGSRVQNVLTALKVGLIAGLIVIGFAFGTGTLSHLAEGELFDFNFSGWKTMGLSLMWIMFAFSGWNAAAYIGSEIKDPEKNLPRSLILGTIIVTLLYLLLNLLFVYAVAPSTMAGVVSIGGLAVGQLFGFTSEVVLSILIAIALFSSLSAFIILGPRVYYSMAKDGYFFRFAGEIHPRYGVPSKSIALQGLVAAVMVGVGAFDQILTYMGFSLGVFPILAVVGVFILRRQGKSVFRSPGYPVVPLIYILASVSILVLAYFERPIESSIAVAMIIVGLVAYRFVRKGAALSPSD
ncbi:MAG: amino acid permease [bacterium]|nr:amino acid permease [bacterium]